LEAAEFPSLGDYKRFHGMLCGVRTAKKCIQSFDGVVLFADQTFYDDETRSLSTVDYNSKDIPPFMSLNVWSYYLLVLFSMTGLCTLLGQTRMLYMSDTIDIRFEKGISNVESNVIRGLHIPPKVLEYIRRKSNITNDTSVVEDEVVIMKRMFGFDFGGYLSVIMVHFVCNGRQSLVEVYRIENTLFGKITKFVLQQPIQILRYLFLNGTRPGAVAKEKNR
jgi:hypothetical protein